MTKWVGFPNTSGTPDAISTQGNYTNSSDRTYCRRWTASEDGVISGINIRPGTDSLADLFIVVYRQVQGSGDIDKIAQMDITDNYSQQVWRGYETAIVFGAESLSFDSGDILWFGVGFDGATGTGGLNQDDDDTTGEVYNQFNSSVVNPSTGPNSTLVFSTSGANRGLCAILRYEEPSDVDDLEATDITTGSPSVASPTIGQIHALSATGITSGNPVLDTPTIGQIHVLSSTGIVTLAPVLDAPTLAVIHNLSATDITTGSPVLDTPTIGQIHALDAVDITTGNPVLDTPTLGEGHNLTANDIVTGNPVLDTPTIGQIHALSATGITSGNPVLDTPTIGQIHALISSSIVTEAPVLDSPALAEVHALVALNIATGNPVLGTPTLAEGVGDALIASSILTGVPVIGSPVIGFILPETPTDRKAIVLLENRTTAVSLENRIAVVDFEDRTIIA